MVHRSAHDLVHSVASFILLSALLLLPLLGPATASSAEDDSARLSRVAIRPRATHTRISFHFNKPPEYSLSVLPGGKVTVTFLNAGGPLHKRLRSYSDQFVNGVRIAPRGNTLRVSIFARQDNPAVRPLWMADAGILALDIGAHPVAAKGQVTPEREPILAGAGKLVKEFDPPFKPIFPFLPTDRRELLALISERDAQLFMAGEAALYKGKAAQAEELFAVFSTRESPVRPLANYRLGESLYILQKYEGALRAFREGEKLWPEYLSFNPAVAFYYADSIVRSGDFTGGRKSLTRLIASLADRKYAPLLLVRLADTLARQRHDLEAQAIYRTVAANFPGDKASSYAALKLADGRIFTVTGDNYSKLLQEYQTLVDKGQDPSLREEALFKVALLESLYGPANAALQMVMQYEKKYPRGIFIAIARGMREELLPIICRELYAAKDFAGLITLVHDNQNYLSRCFADGRFAEWLDEAYVATGQLKKEISLFGSLLDREWAAPHVPFMLVKIMDHAVTLADHSLAENTGRGFVKRFPGHASVWAVREKLGKICFMKNDMATVASELGWLLAGSRPAELPESWYYLGRSLAVRKEYKNADRAFSRFISLVKGETTPSPLLVDAYYEAASSRAAGGDRAGGMALYRTGLEVAGRDRHDQFLYKIGELHLLEGEQDEAKSSWERIVKEGSDPLWQKMATQSLADLEWRAQFKKMSK